MSSGSLTEEQRKRIEENRRKALEKRATLLSQRQQQKVPSTTTSSATSNSRGDPGKFSPNNAVQPSRKEHVFPSSSTVGTKMPQRRLPLQSGGVKPSASLQLVGKASNTVSNTNIVTNGRAKPPSVGSNTKSQNSAVGAATSISKPSNGPASLNSFQSTVSQFYRPQSNPSSSIRKFETSKTSTLSTTTASTSVNNRAGPSKSVAASSLNFRKSEKEVKGNCVLISRQRFTVVVPYQAQLIGIFKTIPSRSYGKIDSLAIFILETHNS